MAPVQYDDTEFHQKLCRKLNCHLPSLNPIHCYDFPSEPENIYQERHEEGESYSFHPSINLILSPSFSCFYRSDEANKMIKIKRDRKRITTFSIDKPSSSCYLLSVQANKIIGMCSFTLVARQWLPGDYLIEKKKMPPLCFDSTIKKHKQGQLFNYSITQTGTLLLFYDFVVS